MKLEDLNEAQREKIMEFGVNTWFVLDLYKDYKKDPSSVTEKWKDFFKTLDIAGVENEYQERKIPTNGETKTQPVQQQPQPKIYEPSKDEELVLIKGVGARIIENMDNSLSVPTATSFRTIPVKILEENRIIINQFLKANNRGKISYTHIIGWAIVLALKEQPVMNNSFTFKDGQPYLVKKSSINLGLAVDLEKKDGTRTLIVPNIKNAGEMTFGEYFEAYNDIINRSRANKIEVEDFAGTTISLTNPGTLGTVTSAPRLMTGQGAIIATGSIEYPAEFHAMSKSVVTSLGLSKVMNITSTYDHRVIQGAESGLFLKRIHELLLGQDGFYTNILKDFGIPVKPIYWSEDRNQYPTGNTSAVSEIERHAKAIQLINMFRVRGHLLADLDPLEETYKYHPELDSTYYGFTVWDLDREYITDGLAGLRTAKLRDILDILRETYGNKIGVEYRHIQDPEEKEWLQDTMEKVHNRPNYNNEVKRNILRKLIQAEMFEKYIDKKYLGQKRFSLEGSETIIAVLDHIMNLGSEDGVEEFVLGMAHRGRLNVLTNIIGKSLYSIFSEFEGFVDPNSVQGSGDVKYHVGASGEYECLNGKTVKVSVASNPSHLEFVNPVVEGIVRAKQTRLKDEKRNRIIPVLLHGDAAFAGQGIVAETLNLSQLRGYSTGGTIHIVINNQIGFTTSPVDARSTVYATDVAKMVQAPILHVNGDKPEATLWVTEIAYKYRQKFKKDVVIDVYGYRRLGHNETDEPAYTQPLMYKKIRQHPSVVKIYEKKLLDENVFSEGEIKTIEKDVTDKMDFNYEKARADVQKFKTDLPLAVTQEQIDEIRKQEIENITSEEFDEIVKKITEIPSDFTLHPKLKKFIDTRKAILEREELIDWAFAEAITFGSLMNAGISIRLSGQDSARGTFSQRHNVLTDVNNASEINIHRNFQSDSVIIETLDSLLSEAAVLGFEFGYSTSDPLTLVMWEAQFGDFANGAQVIIDNFISSAESKWMLPSDLVLLLPHGQEGQGPEHSSARLERFLELCADNNMFVCNPTTSAQYYHLLRRQALDDVRKPLIVMTPKSLLREKLASSHKDDIIHGYFKHVLDDIEVEPTKVKRLGFTSGKVYYDLLKYRHEKGIDDTALVRIEQYFPFPKNQIAELISKYKNAEKILWIQEESENAGAWNFMSLKLMNLAGGIPVQYVGRKASASTAPGSKALFDESQLKLIKSAFGIDD
ncbi:MAG: multifunctional oxoglutarate decarboxylase/oxoglutarate dehydrogenase thiamine pyrophosphate-binding subunit/dihydrolipoyllysine-residue succinyltransferase subunit [Ignavibacteria bacterium]|nr:Multifunctional 2-oxoglutarate metabolism enzyme [Ignavibacteria bacterium]MCC6886642.1 multifunctional oxoglutarate decarboxylase/oxoglutarate dehydrogenase thiamine pyrophosphate-binding subunit/dihydrolipoyllysine-residue succinyltransferase subunit [Ignavibacteriales bacterium]